MPCVHVPGKGMTSWLLFIMFNCVFVTFPCGILGQVWYLIVSIPDRCHLSYLGLCTGVEKLKRIVNILLSLIK